MDSTLIACCTMCIIYNANLSFIPNGKNILPLHTNAGLNSVIFNIEGWYRYTFGGNFYLEPQIELITGYIGEINIKNLDILLSMKDSIPISSKITIFTGKQFNISNHTNIIDSLSFRVGFGYAYDLKAMAIES